MIKWKCILTFIRWPTKFTSWYPGSIRHQLTHEFLVACGDDEAFWSQLKMFVCYVRVSSILNRNYFGFIDSTKDYTPNQLVWICVLFPLFIHIFFIVGLKLFFSCTCTIPFLARMDAFFFWLLTVQRTEKSFCWQNHQMNCICRRSLSLSFSSSLFSLWDLAMASTKCLKFAS